MTYIYKIIIIIVVRIIYTLDYMYISKLIV